MLINIPLYKNLQKYRLNYNDYVFLKQCQMGESIFLEDEEEGYIVAQKLIIMKLLKVSNEESNELFELTEEGIELLNKIEN